MSMMVPCGASNPLCLIPQIFAAEADIAIDKATDATGQTIRHWVGEGAGVVLQATATGWTNITTPAVGTDAGVASDDVVFLQGSVLWLSLSILVISFIASMGMMAFSGEARHGLDAFKGIIRYLGVTALAVPVVAIAVTVVDAASAWIIERATGDDFATGLGTLLIDTGGLGLAVYLIITVIAIFVSGFLIVLLIWRGGAIIVLVGSIGLAAAIGTTETGKSMLSKYIGWIVAYVMYKLAAAIFYAAAFRMMSVQSTPNADDQSAILLRQMTGISLMFLALLALPAMIRLVSPLSAAVASGRGFGGAAMGALAIALPTGAIAAGGAAAAAGGAAAGGSSSGGGGGGNDSGPSGAVTPPPSSSPAPPPPSGNPDLASKGSPVPV